jgi:hypothetical protein
MTNKKQTSPALFIRNKCVGQGMCLFSTGPRFGNSVGLSKNSSVSLGASCDGGVVGGGRFGGKICSPISVCRTVSSALASLLAHTASFFVTAPYSSLLSWTTLLLDAGYNIWLQSATLQMPYTDV